MALLLPALSAARERARMVSCQSNLRQMQMTFFLYLDDHNGTTPGAVGLCCQPDHLTVLRLYLPNLPKMTTSQFFAKSPPSLVACPTTVLMVPGLQRDRLAGGLNRSTTYAANLEWAQDLLESSWGCSCMGGPISQFSSFRRWTTLRRPAEYPWYGDSECSDQYDGTTWVEPVLSWQFEYTKFRHIGRPPADPTASTGPKYFANFSMADGHVEAITYDQMLQRRGINWTYDRP